MATQPASLPRIRRNGSLAEDHIDPYELVRRLSAIQAEETIKELERKRIDWESELYESRSDQQDEQGQAAAGCSSRRTSSSASQQPAAASSNFKPQKGHKRSASITLAPNQLPPPAYTDLPPAPRKQSLPLNNRPQSRRPSLKRGDSALDLETISEDAVVEPSLENLFPEWNMADKRKRSSMLRSVDENFLAPGIVSTQPVSRRRSSLLSQGASSQGSSSGRLDPWSGSEGQPSSRRQSALLAQRRHSRQDWSQSDEPSPSQGSRRRSSVIDKMSDYWKPASVDQGSDAGDSDVFDSRATTMRNSWRSSMGSSGGGSTTSRRASMLKKVGDYWVVKPPLVDNETSVQDIHTDEDEEDQVARNSASKKKMSSLFSKLRL